MKIRKSAVSSGADKVDINMTPMIDVVFQLLSFFVMSFKIVAQEGDFNIKMPIGVVKWGMKMAQAFSPQMKEVDLDWESIDAMVQEGETGKMVEVEDETEHKTIEVWLE